MVNGQQIDLFTIHETHTNCVCGQLLLVSQSKFVEGYGHYCNTCYRHEFDLSLHDSKIYHRSLLFRGSSNGSILRTVLDDGNEWFLCSSSHNIYPVEFRVYVNDTAYHRNNVPPSHRVHNYSFRPNIKYVDSRSAKKLYFGVELEISGGGCSERTVSRVLETVNGTNTDKFLYAKHDSSVESGFEIVSQPHSFRALMRQPWNDLLKTAQELGFRSNAKAGLHVHMSKKFFGSSSLSQEQGLMKLVYIIEKFWKEFFVFSRRDESSVQQYARPFGLGGRTPDRLLNDFKRHQQFGQGRYTAVNLLNSNTAELRFFRTTLDNTTLLATYQLCYELANFCNNFSILDVVDIDWSSFVSSLGKHNELQDYLANRRLINPTSNSLITESVINDLF